MKPTPEQLNDWVAAVFKTKESPFETLANLAFQAGREAALQELRAGGVELPEPDGTTDEDIDIAPALSMPRVLDYGDRRAAAIMKPGRALVPEVPTKETLVTPMRQAAKEQA